MNVIILAGNKLIPIDNTKTRLMPSKVASSPSIPFVKPKGVILAVIFLLGFPVAYYRIALFMSETPYPVA